jgi:hypothetical protein
MSKTICTDDELWFGYCQSFRDIAQGGRALLNRKKYVTMNDGLKNSSD